MKSLQDWVNLLALASVGSGFFVWVIMLVLKLQSILNRLDTRLEKLDNADKQQQERLKTLEQGLKILSVRVKDLQGMFKKGFPEIFPYNREDE